MTTAIIVAFGLAMLALAFWIASTGGPYCWMRLQRHDWVSGQDQGYGYVCSRCPARKG